MKSRNRFWLRRRFWKLLATHVPRETIIRLGLESTLKYSFVSWRSLMRSQARSHHHLADTGAIIGGKINEYLLEKSRIVSHALEERNYHSFYGFLASATASEKEQWGLKQAEDYFYLNRGKTFQVPDIKDGEQFLKLKVITNIVPLSAPYNFYEDSAGQPWRWGSSTTEYLARISFGTTLGKHQF